MAMNFDRPEGELKPTLTLQAPEAKPYDILEDRDRTVAELANSEEIDRLTSLIDVNDMTTIVTFGSGTVEEISKASDVVLRSMSLGQMDESSQMLESLAKIMSRFDADELKDSPRLFGRLLGNVRGQLERILTKYNTMGDEVDRIYVQLKGYEAEIKRSNQKLEEMFQANVQYFHELEKYIVAGDQGCREIDDYMEQLRAEQERTGDQAISFELQTLQQARTMLEQRTLDLRTAEAVALQSIPMLKAMQYNNMNLVRKINSAFIITLPVFKQALAQAILLKRQKLQSDAMSALDRRTNELLLRNARNTLDSAEDACNAALEAAEDAEAAYLDAQWNEKVELDNQNMILTKLKEERDSIQAELDSLEYLRSQDQANLSAEDLERLHELEAKENTLKEQLSDKQEEINRKTLEVISLETAYNQIVSAYEQADAQVETARNALNRAAEAYDTQLATFRATNTTVDNTLADYLTNVQTAWDNYQEALTSLAATEKTVNEQLKTYENNVTSAQIGANKAAQEESLRQLKENLDDTQVTAPVSGTVTAVYAKVGSSGSGLLFVIENVDELIVDTSVKGYDVGTVQTGMKVLIRSDATGDAEMDGTITSIAPTSKKNAMGQTDTTGEAVFAAEVAVTSKDTGLRIGMEAQLDYILEEQSHVLAVPYDAVYLNEAGETCILIAEPVDDADHYLIRSIPVTTGMDDDLDMVVTGPEIREGLMVINEADSYLELLGQTVLAGTGIHADLIAAMMGG